MTTLDAGRAALIEKVLTEQERWQLGSAKANYEATRPGGGIPRAFVFDLLAIIDTLVTHGVECEETLSIIVEQLAGTQTDYNTARDSLRAAETRLAESEDEARTLNQEVAATAVRLFDAETRLAECEAQLAEAERDRDYWKSTAFREQEVHQQAARDRDTAEAIVRTVGALRDEHLHDGALVDGCTTGDCPHGRQAECDDHLAVTYRELVIDLDAALAGGRDDSTRQRCSTCRSTEHWFCNNPLHPEGEPDAIRRILAAAETRLAAVRNLRDEWSKCTDDHWRYAAERLNDILGDTPTTPGGTET